MAVGDKIYIATKEYVEQSLDELNNKVDLAVIDTQSGSFVQSTVADDCVAEVTIEGKTVVTPLDPTQDISPDNPATIVSVGDSPFDIVSYVGKNLLVNNAASSTTINGITFTVNPDKSITMNGTATVNANFPIFGVNWNDISSRMPLNPSQTYILSRGSANAIIYLRDAISNKNFETPLGGTRLITGISQFTYVYIQVVAGRTCNNETIYPQLEIGSVATSYEPYKSNKITISSFSGRSLPNGVCDKLELFANGKRRDIQNVYIAVFDGSNDENWVLGPLQPNDLTLARFCYNNQNIAMGSKVISDRFEFESSNYWQNNQWHLITKECIAPHATTGQINIIIKKSRIQGWSDDLSNSEKIALFKAWLATNHITVLYELAEPIITESEYAQLKTYKGITNIYTTDPLQPNLIAKFLSRLGNFAEVIMARLDKITQALLALGGTV